MRCSQRCVERDGETRPADRTPSCPQAGLALRHLDELSSDSRPVPAIDETFASLPRRSLAWTVDVVLVTALILAAGGIVDAIVGPAVQIRQDAETLQDVMTAAPRRVVLHAIIGTVLSAAYFAVSWVVVGASPGQLAFRLRVAKRGGVAKLTLGGALARWLLLFPPFATVSALTPSMPSLTGVMWASAVVWYFLLLLTTARSDSKQGLHDQVARSIVYTRRSAT